MLHMHNDECEQREGVMRRRGVLLTVVTLLMVGCGNGQTPSPATMESTTVPSSPPIAASAPRPPSLPITATPAASASRITDPSSRSGEMDDRGTEPLASAPFPVNATAAAGAHPGGGTRVVGPFVFSATLYTDPDIHLPAKATAAWLTSDVEGVGVSIQWQYQGAGMAGPIRESSGPPDRIQAIGSIAALSPGQRGGHEGGGLLLPAGATVGSRTWYGLRLDTPTGVYGVKVVFTLDTGAEGLDVTNIAVESLP